MHLSYSTDPDQIKNLIILGKEVTVDQTVYIKNHVAKILKTEHETYLLNVLTSQGIIAIYSDNLNKSKLIYLSNISKSFDTIILSKISDLDNIEVVLRRNRSPFLHPFTKIHYSGEYGNKMPIFYKVSHSITELIVPSLNNIDLLIYLNPNLKSIGVHGEAFFRNTEDRNWHQLISIINANKSINFILFFNERKDIENAQFYLIGLPNTKMTLFSTIS